VPFELTAILWFGATLVLFFGALVQGVIGFGFGMVSMAVLPFLFDVRVCVPLVCVFGIVVQASILWNIRADIDFKKSAPMMAGALVGIPIGVGFLYKANESMITLVLGVVIVAYVLWSTLGSQSSGQSISTRWGYLAGLFGGALGGAFNVSGPPVVMYVSGQPWSPGATKAALQIFFVMCSLTQSTLYSIGGLLTLDVLKLNGLMVVGVLAGAWVGSRVADGINKESFRKMVLGGLLILGVVYIARSIV